MELSKAKIVADEGKSVEGVTIADGKYVSDWDFKEAFEKLKAEEWERYKDISFAAYFTDASTNRTEQQRFDVRLTKEPIHIYFIRYYQHHEDLPAVGYVSTFYADGTPAVCDVMVTDAARTIARFRTNAMGAGKFETAIPRQRLDRDRYDVKVTARDKKGLQGTYDESFSMSTEDAVQIRTDKTIYAREEPVEVDYAPRKGATSLCRCRQGLRSGSFRACPTAKRTSAPDASVKGDVQRRSCHRCLYRPRDRKVERRYAAVRGIIFPDSKI